MEATSIAWAAGFLEGEGSFLRNKGYAKIRATQKDREMLDRLCELFGGTVCLDYGPARRESGRCPLWQWQIYGEKAERVMRSVMPYMSTKRSETIALALNPDTLRWKA